MTLTLVSTEDGYNVYEDEDFDEILIATSPPFPRIVVFWEDFDIVDAWADAVRLHYNAERWGSPNRLTFAEDIRLGVADPDAIDFVWCECCEEPVKIEAAESVSGGYACTSCYEDNYYGCSDCGESVHSDDSYYTLHSESVCGGCLNRHYSHCDECDGYYHEDYSEDHVHGGCDCESPAQVFAMRNDGEPVLNQDERVTIALPSGVISSEGIESIATLIRNHGYTLVNAGGYTMLPDGGYPDSFYEERSKWFDLASGLEDALGGQWQTKEGNYTKRLSKLAYKSHGLKIPPAVLSQVGCIARDNSTGVDFAIEVTRDLNLSAEEFYHEDSCWWQSYSESRCSLKSNGGIGMRTFGGPYGEVRGRAWIMPLRLVDGELVATFDSLTPDGFMVFNGYGDLSGYTPARIVSHMAGMTYRKISFDCSPMYVNNGSGYLVTSEEIANQYATKGRLTLNASVHSNLHHKEEVATLVAA